MPESMLFKRYIWKPMFNNGYGPQLRLRNLHIKKKYTHVTTISNRDQRDIALL